MTNRASIVLLSSIALLAGAVSVAGAAEKVPSDKPRQLMTRYFPDAKFSDAVRPPFAFASYKAGPGNISKMRKEAAKRGLDPDKWFNNVELAVAERTGTETTTYVRNIDQYYVAYKLTFEAHETRRKAIEQTSAPARQSAERQARRESFI